MDLSRAFFRSVAERRRERSPGERTAGRKVRGAPPKFRFPLRAGERSGGLLRAAYRRWWAASLPTPYGYCACGCGRPTLTAPRDSPQKGHVAGEKKPFIDRHEALWGFPHVTDPDRRCACGCGLLSPRARKTLYADGEIEEFAGMRARYRNRAHRPSGDVTRIDGPLGSPGQTLTALEVGYLAGIFDGRASFTKDRSPYLKTRRGHVLRCFARLSGRGSVDVTSRRSPRQNQFLWRADSLLEAANLLHHLWPLLLPATRALGACYLAAHEFPAPREPVRESFEASEGSLASAQEAGWLLGTLACRGQVHASQSGARARLGDPGPGHRERLAAFTFADGTPLLLKQGPTLYLSSQSHLARLLQDGRELLPPGG